MEDLNRPRTRSTTGTRTSSGLNKYNDLLRTTTTQEEEEPLTSQQNVKVRVRGSTNLFVDALEPLGPERRQMLEDTPFHKLLGMDGNIQNNVIIKKLAAMFNTQDHSIELKGERHVVSAQDVTAIMGIEDGEEEIKMPGRGQKTHVPDKLKKDFVKRGQKGICMEKVKTKLRESLDEDAVKRAYMLLALRYIVYPPSDHDYLPESCLDLVRDVSALNKKKWATFVITSLVNGIEKFNNYKGNKETYIGGCALFLQLYSTKGSINTPKGNLECDKRRTKTRDKECSGSSSSETIESSLLKAMDTTRIIYENATADMRKCHKRMSSRFKNNESDNYVTQRSFETIFSMLESQRDTTIAEFQKSLDEHVAGVARREDP